MMTIARFMAVAVFILAAAPTAMQAQAAGGPTAVVAGLTPGQITFSVKDVARETAWYIKIFGFKVARTNTPKPGFVVRSLTMPGFGIDLVKQEGSADTPWPNDRYSQQGYVHFAFYTTELPTALKALQAADADVTPLKDDRGAINRLIVHDPEGNELELFINPNK